MTNLKNDVTKTGATKIKPFKGWGILLALVLVATIAGVALASNGKAKGHTFDSTFTKWVTYWPPTPPTQDEPVNMVGVVGGDVGSGTYTGEAISVSTVGNITSIEALYHFNGRKHSFTAHLYVTQDDLAGKATIRGYVTEGWQEGGSVTGNYRVLVPCPRSTPGNFFDNPPVCFRGVLHVKRP